MPDSMNFMSSKRQQELVDAVKDAADLHLEGMPASDAIAKVASDSQMSENETKLMVEAFNTSKTLAHVRSAQGSEKAASFDLADYDTVIAKAFPAKEDVKVAFITDYRFSESVPSYFGVAGKMLEKVATTLIESQEGIPVKDAQEVTVRSNTPSDLTYRKAYNACDYWRKKAEEHRAKAAEMRGQVYEACEAIAEGFKTPAGIRGWSTFAKEAESLHGEVGKKVVETIADDFGLNGIMARHGSKGAAVTLPDPDAKNHKLLKIALLSMEVAAEEMDSEDDCRRRLEADKARWFRDGGVKTAAKGGGSKHPDLDTQAKIDAYRNRLLLPKAKQEYRDFRRESAEKALAPITGLTKSVGDATTSVGGMIDKVRESVGKLHIPESVEHKKELQLDPRVGMESEYQNAVFQMNLQDMLENDPVISGHVAEDPYSVLSAVQELADIQPEILSKPIALRAMLRRHLEMGQTELHELEQQRKVVADRPPKDVERALK